MARLHYRQERELANHSYNQEKFLGTMVTLLILIRQARQSKQAAPDLGYLAWW